ncbi:hypothetical protein [Paenibacillus pini]|uniref:hypothetical protein n=1 Tax=Paenibacillus pini TaxID=669461 RepID=UPI0005655A1A|nr:hypothetical protein [Paenibacillus pini]
MKKIYILIFIIGVSLVFTGCSEKKESVKVISTENSAINNSNATQPSDSNNTAIQKGLVGSVNVKQVGSDTIARYTFSNQSKKQITVIGGARYILIKDNNEIEKGSVPIKDYIDLQYGQSYTDEKTFKNLEPGTYSIQVEWDHVEVTTNFTRN